MFAAPPSLTPPIPGAIVGAFARGTMPFAAGAHRGIDFAAASGQAVRAPCSGRAAFVGRTPRGPGITLICDGYRVTLLGVRATTRQGTHVPSGGQIAAATAATIYLSVRPSTDRFTYIDPTPLLADAPPPTGPQAPPIATRARQPDAPAPPTALPPPSPAPRPAASTRIGPPPPSPARWPTPSTRIAPPPPSPAPRPTPAPPPATPHPQTPWPVWLGIAAALAALAGGRPRALARRRPARTAAGPCATAGAARASPHG